MDLPPSTTSSSFSGSTIVNLSGEGAASVEDDDRLFRDFGSSDSSTSSDDLTLFENDSDAEQRRRELEWSDFRENIPTVRGNLLEDEALAESEPYRHSAVIQRLSVWFGNIVYMGSSTLASISRRLNLPTSPDDIPARNSPPQTHLMAHGASHDPASDDRRLSHLNKILRFALISAFFTHLDVILRVIKDRISPLKSIFLGRFLLMFAFCSMYAATTRSRHGGRGQGEIVMMTHFLTGFLLAKVLPVILERYDLVFADIFLHLRHQ